MNPELPRDVILHAREGNRDDFRIVVEHLQKLAYNIAYRITWNAHDSEDAAQEIFLRLHRNFLQYDPEQPFLPWFRRLAVNCVLNWREKRRPMLELPEVATRDPEPVEPDARLRQAISELPSEYQSCITLKYIENLGVREIAEALQVPPGTVKTWLFRAREILMKKLKPNDDHPL